ncbi:jerky protein homolog-like [Corticium candelabrum]|uniref:jerky protein homolog-like n=1 Tax=Corticium candelabrum TaxID=121492 RepID=UPI002E2746FD|nr:jerky protein homolog-like [Corticium candelabrum]
MGSDQHTCSMASKQSRKRSVITLEKKLKLISELEKGQSFRLVSQHYNIPKSTLADIWKSRDKISRHVSGSEIPDGAKKRRVVKEPQFEKIDEACYMWFAQQRAKGASVSGPLLQEKALALFPSLYPDEEWTSFKASSGWLQKFCRRHGIRSMTLQGESLSADLEAVDPFCHEFRTMLDREGYSKDQIFNADETGLWWRLLPSRSLVCSGEKKALNFKKSKDRITLLGCANASGTFRMPLCTRSPSVEILKSRDGKVSTLFLPTNTTSLIQPMDQGVLEACKQRYRKHLLRYLIVENEKSWNEAAGDSLRKAWNKLLPTDTICVSDSWDSTDNLEMLELFSELGYIEGTDSWQTPEEWLNEDNFDPGHQLLTDSEIVAEVLGEQTNESSDSDSEDAGSKEAATVTNAEAFEALGTVLEWLEARGDTDSSHLLLVKKWKDTAARLRRKSMVQNKVTTYFTK